MGVSRERMELMGLVGRLGPGGPLPGEFRRVEYVDQWFYSRDGRRFVGKRCADGRIVISSLASLRDQAWALSELVS